jgi:calcium-dependent protein kinase
MGNCCGTPNGATDAGGGKKPKEPKQKKGKKPNPFSIEYNGSAPASALRLVVLREPTGRDIAERYELGAELGRGEFGVTYLCTDRALGEALACKSISKKKLRTPVGVEDVRREVEIMGVIGRSVTGAQNTGTKSQEMECREREGRERQAVVPYQSHGWRGSEPV